MENQTTPASNKIAIIKNIYFYLVSFVALMMVVFSVADLVNLALKTWVFTKADGYYVARITDCSDIPQPTDPASRQMTEEECVAAQEANRQREEENQIAQKQRNAVRDISFVVVGIPLFIVHWRAVRKKNNV